MITLEQFIDISAGDTIEVWKFKSEILYFFIAGDQVEDGSYVNDENFKKYKDWKVIRFHIYEDIIRCYISND